MPTTSTATITLKPRQAEAYESIKRNLKNGVTRQLVNLPTGLGKTILAIHTAGDFTKTLITVPTLELMSQTENTIKRVHPNATIKRLHGTQTSTDAQFIISTIATLNRRLNQLNPNEFSLLIVDESHHAKAATWENVINHFTPQLLLGLSATPERRDGLPLSDIFDDITYTLSTKDAVNENYLTQPIGIEINTHADLDDVRSNIGDLNQKDLNRIINTPQHNKLITDAHHKHAAGRQTLVFTVTIKHAQAIAHAFQERGVKADWVSGTDPHREEKLARYNAGEITVLTNAHLLTEGYDNPNTSCIIMARPTTSKVIYTQAVGRGLRTHQGKNDCIIIDVTGNTRKHRLVSIWDFWGTPRPENTNDPINLALRDAKRERIIADRYQRITGKTAELPTITKFVNLLEPAPQIETPSQLTEHQTAPAHTNALRMLLQYGYNVFDQTFSVWQANQALKIARANGRQRNPNIIPA